MSRASATCATLRPHTIMPRLLSMRPRAARIPRRKSITRSLSRGALLALLGRLLRDPCPGLARLTESNRNSLLGVRYLGPRPRAQGAPLELAHNLMDFCLALRLFLSYIPSPSSCPSCASRAWTYLTSFSLARRDTTPPGPASPRAPPWGPSGSASERE